MNPDNDSLLNEKANQIERGRIARDTLLEQRKAAFDERQLSTYETNLKEEDVDAYEAWLSAAEQHGLREKADESNYDLVGHFYAAREKANELTDSSEPQDAQYAFDPYFAKPNHPAFDNETGRYGEANLARLNAGRDQRLEAERIELLEAIEKQREAYEALTPQQRNILSFLPQAKKLLAIEEGATVTTKEEDEAKMRVVAQALAANLFSNEAYVPSEDLREWNSWQPLPSPRAMLQHMVDIIEGDTSKTKNKERIRYEELLAQGETEDNALAMVAKEMGYLEGTTLDEESWWGSLKRAVIKANTPYSMESAYQHAVEPDAGDRLAQERAEAARKEGMMKALGDINRSRAIEQWMAFSASMSDEANMLVRKAIFKGGADELDVGHKAWKQWGIGFKVGEDYYNFMNLTHDDQEKVAMILTGARTKPEATFANFITETVGSGLGQVVDIIGGIGDMTVGTVRNYTLDRIYGEGTADEVMRAETMLYDATRSLEAEHGPIGESIEGAVEQLGIMSTFLLGGKLKAISALKNAGKASWLAEHSSQAILTMWYASMAREEYVRRGGSWEMGSVLGLVSGIAQSLIETQQFNQLWAGRLTDTQTRVAFARASQQFAKGFALFKELETAKALGHLGVAWALNTAQESIEEGMQRFAESFVIEAGLTDGDILSALKQAATDACKEIYDTLGTMGATSFFSIGTHVARGAKFHRALNETYAAESAFLKAFKVDTQDGNKTVSWQTPVLDANGKPVQGDDGNAQTQRTTTTLATLRKGWLEKPTKKERIAYLMSLGMDINAAGIANRVLEAQDIMRRRYRALNASYALRLAFSQDVAFEINEEHIKRFAEVVGLEDVQIKINDNVATLTVKGAPRADGTHATETFTIRKADKDLDVAANASPEMADSVRNSLTRADGTFDFVNPISGEKMTEEQFVQAWTDTNEAGATFRAQVSKAEDLRVRGLGTRRQIILANGATILGVIHENIHRILRFAEETGLVDSETIKALKARFTDANGNFDEEAAADFAASMAFGKDMAFSREEAGALAVSLLQDGLSPAEAAEKASEVLAANRRRKAEVDARLYAAEERAGMQHTTKAQGLLGALRNLADAALSYGAYDSVGDVIDNLYSQLINLPADTLATAARHVVDAGDDEEQAAKYSVSADAAAQVQREYDEVVAKYKGTDQWLKAPNGKPTNLTERQWVQVRTPSFKAWFGDWENDPANASKIIDENGEPKVVYHGSKWNPLDEEEGNATFKHSKIRNSSEGVGFYFTPNRDLAEGWGEVGGYFLNIKNPTYAYNKLNLLTEDEIYDIEERDDVDTEDDASLKNAIDEENAKRLKEKMREVIDILHGKGYDFYPQIEDEYVESIQTTTVEGVLDYAEDIGNYIVQEDYNTEKFKADLRNAQAEVFGIDGYFSKDYGDGGAYVAFTPSQIKSATDNIGTFDATNPDIRYSISSKATYDPRSLVPKVRGGWTEEKILRFLKKNPSLHGEKMAIRLISEFDTPEELKAHMFYHGTRSYVGELSPSITKSKDWVERYGGGGYGMQYWGISVSKSKKVSSNFGDHQQGKVTIYPIVLAKGAKVIERPDFTDAADLEDHIVDLWTEGVDAVWIGDKDAGEQELCVINPLAICNIGKGDFYRMYKLGSESNPINIKDDEQIAAMLEVAKERRTRNLYKDYNKPRKPFRFEFEEGNEAAYDAAIAKYNEDLAAWRESPEGRAAEKYLAMVRDTIRFSIVTAEQDLAHKRAVEEGDLDVAQRLVNEAAKQAGFIPVTLWHQTSKQFTEFKTDNPNAGLNDSETPNGIFLKTNDHDIGLGGNIQMPLLLKADNILHFKNREEANAWYCKHVGGYEALQNEMKEALQPHLDKLDQIEKEMFKTETDEAYEALSVEEDKAIEQLGEVERKYRGQLRELLNQHFLANDSGYDAIELDYDGHRWVDGKRENVHTFIAFNPNQVKSSEPATFDDNGNLIPLSERFNLENEDVRYSVVSINGRDIALLENEPLTKNEAQDEEKVREVLATVIGKSFPQQGEETQVEITKHFADEFWGSNTSTKLRDKLDKLWRAKVGTIPIIGDILKTTPLGPAEVAKHINAKFKERATFYRCPVEFGIKRWNGIAIYKCDMLILEMTDNGRRYVYDFVKINKPTLTAKSSLNSDLAQRLYGQASLTGESVLNSHTISNSAPNVKEKNTSADNASNVRFSIAKAQAQGMANEPLAVDSSLVTTDANGTSRFSIRTYEEGGRDVLEAYLQGQVAAEALTRKDADDILAELDNVYEICKIYADDPELKSFGLWSKAVVEVDDEGNPLFGVVRPNGDYAYNIDFSTVCKKRRPLNRIFAELVNRGIVTDENIAEFLAEDRIPVLQDIIKEHGLEVACALCFVDSKRYKIGEVAKRFSEMYNGVLAMYNAEDKTAFNDALQHYNDRLAGKYKEWDKKEQKWKRPRPRFYDKVVSLIASDPSARVAVDAGTLISSEGLDAFAKTHHSIFNLYRSFGGVSKAKDAHDDVPYNNDIIRPFAHATNPKRPFWRLNKEKVFLAGGVRVQSFSDFVPAMVFDYMQMFAEMAARGLPTHIYTKEKAFVKIFGNIGAKINMSLVPAGRSVAYNPDGSVYRDADGNTVEMVSNGLKRDINGNPLRDENGRPMYDVVDETFPMKDAFSLRLTYGDKGNVGTIFVGVSDEHIWAMLDDDRIDQIIPYHKSSLNAIVAAMRGISSYVDYTKVQTTKDPSKKTKTNENGEEEAASVDKDFNFYADLKKTKDPRKTANNYLAWCKKRGYSPKFEAFSSHPNYYKLLSDFRLFDNDGLYAPQTAVKATYHRGVAQDIKEALLEHEQAQEALSRETDAIINEFVARSEALDRIKAAAGEILEQTRNAVKGEKAVKKIKAIKDAHYSVIAKDLDAQDRGRKLFAEATVEAAERKLAVELLAAAADQEDKPVTLETARRVLKAFDITYIRPSEAVALVNRAIREQARPHGDAFVEMMGQRANAYAKDEKSRKAYRAGAREAVREAMQVDPVRQVLDREMAMISGVLPVEFSADNGFSVSESLLLIEDDEAKMTQEQINLRIQRRQEAADRAKRAQDAVDGDESAQEALERLTLEEVLSAEQMAAFKARQAKMRKGATEIAKEMQAREEARKQAAKTRAVTASVEEGSTPDIIEEESDDEIFRALVKQRGLDFIDVRELVTYIAQDLATRYLESAPNETLKSLQSSEVFLHELRKTFQAHITTAARDLTYGHAREMVKAEADKVSARKTFYGVMSSAEKAFAMMQGARVRQARKALIKEMIDAITDVTGTKRFESAVSYRKRKLSGDEILRLKYAKKILKMGDTALQRELDALDQQEASIASVDADQDYRDTMILRMKRDVINLYGGLKHMMPAAIAMRRDLLLSEINEGRQAHDQLMAEYEAQVKENKGALALAIEAGAPEVIKEDGLTKRIFGDSIMGLFRLRLESLLDRSKGAIRQSAMDVVDTIDAELSAADAELGARQIENSAKFAALMRKVYGSETKAKQRLNEKLPEPVRAILSKQKVELTRNHALYIFATITQEDYRNNAAIHGRDTRAYLDALMSVLDANDLAFLKGMQKILNDQFPALQKEYRALTGSTVYTTPNYFPMRPKLVQKEDSTAPLAEARSWDGGLVKEMTPRVRHGLDLDETATATGLFAERLDRYARMLAYGRRGTLVRDILLSGTVTGAMERAWGKPAVKRIREILLDTFSGTYLPHDILSDIANATTRITALGQLAYNFSSALVQFSSGWIASAHELGIGNVLKAQWQVMWGLNASDDVKQAIQEVKDSNFYKARYGGGLDLHEREALSMENSGFLSRLYQKGMKPILVADKLTSFNVLVSLYMQEKQKALNRGLSYEDACEKAIALAGSHIERTQQSGRTMDAPNFIRRIPLFRLFFMFASAPLQMAQYEVRAIQSLIHGTEGAGRKLANTLLINHAIIPAFVELARAAFKALFGAGDDDEELTDEQEKLRRAEWAMGFAAECVLGPFSAIPLLGTSASVLANRLLGGPQYAQQWSLASMSYITALAKEAYDIPSAAIEHIFVDQADEAPSMGEILKELNDLGRKGNAIWRTLDNASLKYSDQRLLELLSDEETSPKEIRKEKAKRRRIQQQRANAFDI